MITFVYRGIRKRGIGSSNETVVGRIERPDRPHGEGKPTIRSYFILDARPPVHREFIQRLLMRCA